MLLDEANILIEQLKEQLKSVQNEKERDKKKYAQQLQFMESENNDMQAKLIEWNERYYDDKKKWSSQLRALETEYESIKSAQPVPVPEISDNRSLHAEWEKKFKDIEKAVMIKSKEVSRLVEQNLLLENTIADMNSVQAAEVDAAEDKENISSYREDISTLRRENTELTQTVRKLKHQEAKTAEQLKNQQLLQIEISNCKAKMKGLDDTMNKYKVTERQYQELLAERAELSDAFHQLLADCSRGSGVNTVQAGSTPVKPSAGNGGRIVIADIIGAYRKYQSSYAMLMREATDLKCTITKLTAANQMLGAGAGVSGQGNGDAAAISSQLKRMEQKNSLLNQQVILCTSENKRLRSAILAYDEEFDMIVRKINKVNTGVGVGGDAGTQAPVVAPDILKLKNDVITELYTVLSAHRDVIGKELGLSLPPDAVAVDAAVDGAGKKRRLEGGDTGTAITDTATSATAAVTNTDGSTMEALQASLKEKDNLIADLRQVEAMLRSELYVFQRKCGTDVFPYTVKETGEAAGEPSQGAMGIAQANSHDEAFNSSSSNTRVLHLKVNPFSEVYGPLVAAGVPGKARQVQYNRSLNPSEPTYWLRIAQTQAAMKLNLDESNRASTAEGQKPVNTSAHSNTSGDDLHGNSNSSIMMDASMIAGSHNTSTMTGGVDPAKMNQRLKSIFKEKIAQFREVVYLLTGYKVDLMAADSSSGSGGSHKQTIRLRSMYAEDAEDTILFLVSNAEICTVVVMPVILLLSNLMSHMNGLSVRFFAVGWWRQA